MTDIINEIGLKFKSGNSIPVERAWITAEEWGKIVAHIKELQDTLDDIQSMGDDLDLIT